MDVAYDAETTPNIRDLDALTRAIADARRLVARVEDFDELVTCLACRCHGIVLLALSSLLHPPAFRYLARAPVGLLSPPPRRQDRTDQR